MRGRAAAGLVAAGAVIALASFVAGRATGDDLSWHTGTAVVTDHDGSGQLSVVSADGRVTHGAEGSVGSWTDAEGQIHSGGWPDCLLPPTEQHPERPQTLPIRYATVAVDYGSHSTEMIVTVDCRVN